MYVGINKDFILLEARNELQKCPWGFPSDIRGKAQANANLLARRFGCNVNISLVDEGENHWGVVKGLHVLETIMFGFSQDDNLNKFKDESVRQYLKELNDMVSMCHTSSNEFEYKFKVTVQRTGNLLAVGGIYDVRSSVSDDLRSGGHDLYISAAEEAMRTIMYLMYSNKAFDCQSNRHGVYMPSIRESLYYPLVDGNKHEVRGTVLLLTSDGLEEFKRNR